ncbi:MAG: DUF3427 domain-containing protein, partial [Holdemanella sp.]|nr:DUF3427 domain-containing protein [Holdemanella sp.]
AYIFDIFEKNVPFELRLNDAIKNDLVVPFHYYGIRDQLLDYGILDKDKVARNISDSINVDFIVEEIEKHRPENQKLKCIAFCTSIAHCRLMADEFVARGYASVGLTGTNNTGERIKAFNDLQNDTKELEIICTVDILNEGVDIPAINMVLFLRPTESSTIFLQQLGRGLRKYENKEFLTVLDFIGNNYNRSVQIALALGSLSNSVYMEKVYLKELVVNDYAALNIPGVQIQIDELSKEEIIYYIDQVNFNRKDFLKKDYENFKKYLNNNSIPTHMDYLESDIAPDLMRFLKTKLNGKRVLSYYNFLKSIEEEDLPIFNDDEIKFINRLEEMLPIVRADEYLIVKSMIDNDFNIDSLLDYSSRVTKESLNHAYSYLESKKIISDDKLSVINISNIKEYVLDLINYGLTKYSIDFGEFEGKYKLYANYTKEQSIVSINKEYKMNIQLKGTYIDEDTKETYIYIGLKKDKLKEISTNYKDKFLSPNVFQWESENNTTATNAAGKKLLNTEKVHLFVRKMDEEDNVILPFTYFGIGVLDNMRSSQVINTDTGKVNDTLLFDIILDNEVPEKYHLDFNIPSEDKH